MQFTAKTVEEAIKNGLAELDITEENAEIIVIETPTKGLFGRLKGQAVVDIVKKEQQPETTIQFVQNVLSFIDQTAKATLVEDNEKTVISLSTEDVNGIIGKKGEVIDAIQTLAGAKENIGRREYKKVVVDCENYRERREDTLIKLAHKLEQKATDMRREVILEPMNPYERRIIHTALSNSQTVTTKSDGTEPNRYVVIVPNDKDEFAKPYSAARNNDKRGGNRNHGKRGGFDKRGGNRSNGGARKSSSNPKAKKTITFGTYLGNSLKDKE